MLEAVYILSAATSALCAVLLLRGFSKRGVRLLLWSGLCFVALTADNVLLYFDLVIFPIEVDLRLLRQVVTLSGLAVLIYGLVWESR